MITVTARQLVGWDMVRTAALATIGKKYANGPITDEWKEKILRAEHSPIRCLTYYVEMEVPYFVAMHFRTHKHGVEHFISTQRSDRIGKDRAKLPQDAMVNHAMLINAQALVNMARKRLCSQASPETREAMHKIVSAIFTIDPIVANAMMPECDYRGGVCNEFKPCGRDKS